MDKRVIFAVAGSGKTTHILCNLDLEKKSLIITYTNENIKNLERGIKNKFDGVIPPNIKLMTYFTFLYSFCFIPFLGYRIKPKGMNYNNPPSFTNKLKRTDLRHYIDPSGYMYYNRLAKLISKDVHLKKIISRIEKYFDNIFIDEVQDFAANDFNLITSLSQASIDMLYVGDFHQHTYKTSSDGIIRSNLHVDYTKYLSEFKKSGINPDTKTLKKSWRCSPSVCSFITEKTGINIESHREENTEISFVEDQKVADDLFKNNDIVKLFLKEHDKYDCYSNNWGKSKGMDNYTDVVVVMYKTALDLYKKGELNKLAPLSKNSFYVACSRAKGNLYLVPHNFYKKTE